MSYLKYLCAVAGWITLQGTLLAQPSVDERLTKLEAEMKQVCMTGPSGQQGALFAPQLDSPYAWAFDIEVLLWHAKVGKLDYAINYDQVTYPSNGIMEKLGFGWDWGVRVGATRFFEHDRWDLGLLYTYFGTDDSDKINVSYQTPAGTGGSGSLTSPFGTVKGSFSGKLWYSALDLGLGRTYFVSKNLMLHPHMGLKSVWLSQKYKLYADNYINANNSVLAIAGTLNSYLKDISNVWGIGPHVGLDSSWNMGCGVKFISSVEGALLQSYIKVSQYQTFYIAPTGSTPINTYQNLKAPLHQLVPYTRLLVGLGWNGTVDQGRKYLDISLSYESNYFWRVNQALQDSVTDPANPGFTSTESVRILLNRYSEDVSFYGVTAKIALSF